MLNERLRAGIITTSLVATVGLAGCSNGSEVSTVSQGDIRSSSYVAKVFPGEFKSVPILLRETNPAEYAKLVDGIVLNDKQEPGAPDGEENPVIDQNPSRQNAGIRLRGDSPKLKNDLACDYMRLNTTGLDTAKTLYIGAVGLSESNSSPRILWEKDAEGKPNNYFQICYSQKYEPKDGVILFVSNVVS